MLFLLVAQMLPSVLLVIPLFVLFKRLRLYSTYLGVILADTALALPFAIIILRTSFIQIPDDSKKQRGSMAVRDPSVVVYHSSPGKSRFGCRWRLLFLTAWGEFVFALSFLPKTEMQPVSLGVFQFIGMYKIQFRHHDGIFNSCGNSSSSCVHVFATPVYQWSDIWICEMKTYL